MYSQYNNNTKIKKIEWNHEYLVDNNTSTEVSDGILNELC
jgi:hypothetical protein